MKYNILFVLFLSSCVSGGFSNTNKKDFQPYSSKGFALIYEVEDFNNKIVNKKLDNYKVEVAHRSLKPNTIINITNPENKKNIIVRVKKKANYPEFFNILITKELSKQLELNEKLPYIQFHERIKNKSFIAKKAEMHEEEKKVSEIAPVERIKIDNISRNKSLRKNSTEKFYIVIGTFYSKKTSMQIKQILGKHYVNNQILNIDKKGGNEFELTAGPYTSINALKTDYFKIKKYGFEELDIKKND